MKVDIRWYFHFVCAMLLLGNGLFAANGVDRGVRKTAKDDHYNYIDINTILMWVSNNGDGSFDPNTQIAGFYWPKGTAKTAIYEDGLVWGGFVNGELRVGGSTYRHGLQAGKILPDGSADNPDLEKYRVYKVRKDYQSYSEYWSYLYDPAEYAKLKKDYDEWPVGDGAPAMAYDSSSQQMFPKVGSGFPDEVLWFVSNDLNAAKTTFLYGTNPIGLEVQCTIWGYNQTGALGNMVFKKYRIINKSQNTVDSMFLAYWSDTDLGNGNDDFSGCDTTLSLGYTYNAHETDRVYGVPPAAGYDLLQGPILKTGDPGDTAFFDFQYRYGYKNLPMTAFTFYVCGSAVYSDPLLGTSLGAMQMYRNMNGLVGYTGQPFIDPTTGQPTKFCLAGDPLTRTGWIEGIAGQGCGDRRMLISSGPFTMAPGDTQEVVIGIIIAQAADRLGSLVLLKLYDSFAQRLCDNFFGGVELPPAPNVRAIELDRKVVLDWGEDSSSVAAVETFRRGNFSFEGYNVYQMPTPSASREESKLLATYDRINGVGRIRDYVFDPITGDISYKSVQFGTDCGIRRSFIFDRDYFTDRPLVNGNKYYLAVTSYSYSPLPGVTPNNFESPLQAITVIPHSPNPGEAYHNAPGDTLAVMHSGGRSEGRVYPIVVDPSALNGHQYKVTFDSAGTTWYLTDVTTGQLVYSSTNQSGDGTGVIGSSAYYPIINGFQLIVEGPPPGMKGWEIPSGNRVWTWAGAYFGFEGFYGAIGWASPYSVFTAKSENSAVPRDMIVNTLIKFADTDANGNLRYQGDPNASFGYRYLENAHLPPARPEFVPFIKDSSASFAYQDFTKSVPFAAYDVEANPPQRLAVGYLENNAPNGMVDGKYWPPSYDAGDNIASSGPREWFFIFKVPYSETPDPALEKNILTNNLPVMWFGTPARRSLAFSSHDQFLIIANHANSVNDVFTFTATAPTVGDLDLARAEVEKINVWPNPYFGFNTEELNRYQRFVTFNHLPQRATIRIYTLAGIPVRTIEKNDPSQFARWDLLNHNRFPVASGMYIIYIDMPDLGKTKVLKLAVIMEAQFLDRI